MKKIVVLAPANSIHTKRWVEALSEFYEVTLFSLHPAKYDFNFAKVVTVRNFPLSIFKLFVLISLFIIRNKPSVVHAHYASSYGLVLSLVWHQRKILSVWGSDVYEFPEKSLLHRLLLKWNLRRAKILTSTSYVMAKHVSNYTNQYISVVPFGVDPTALYKICDRPRFCQRNKIVVGTVKALSEKYGIDTLIKSVAYLKDINLDIFDKIECHIYGLGPDLAKLQCLAETLGVAQKIKFCGFIEQSKLNEVLNELDIFLSLSRWESESFGVAVVEAQACSLPVIVTNVGGLVEVVDNKQSGLVVPKNNFKAASKAIVSLVSNPELAVSMGFKGRKSVEKKYDFSINVKQMASIYESDL